MSTFKRPGQKVYSYDFRLRGHRFSGRTGETSKRAADKVEAEVRERERRKLDAGKTVKGSLSVEAAVSRYWLEVAQTQKNAMETLSHLEWLTKALGPKSLLSEIDDARVAQMVVLRRNEPKKRGRNKGGPVSPATVNRTATEPLRKIMRRAEKIWKLGVGEVDWSAHMLREPKERVREASPVEEGRIFEHLARGYDVAVEFTLINSLRQMETVGLTWDRVNIFAREFTVIGKGGKPRTIPMTDRSYRIIWDQRDLNSEYVFTYVAARTDRRKGLVRGQRYPMTKSGLNKAWQTAMKRSGVQDFRFHDWRHTGATRVLRGTGNLRVVQQLLGHEDIKTTTKYAHVTKSDVLAALNAQSPTENATDGGETKANVIESKGKIGD